MPDSSKLMDIIVRLKDQASPGIKKLGKDVGDLPKRVTLADKAFSGLSRTLNGIRGGIAGVAGSIFTLKGAIAGVGLGLLGKSFVSAASTAEQYRTRLTVLLGSQAEGNRLFKEMATYASSVSFEYEQVMGSATALAGVMKGGVDEVKKWIPLVGDIAAASGLGIEEATSQIIRMYSAGAAAADLFRERGVLAMLGFQAGVSYSAEETKKRLIEAWEDPFSKFRGASTLLSGTWSGLMSMMADAWFSFRTMVMESGIFDYMKALAGLMLDWLRETRESGALDKLAKTISDTLVSGLQKLMYFVAGVADAFHGWKIIWEGLKLAYATVAPYIITGLNAIVQAAGGVVVVFGAIADALGFKGIAGSAKEALKMIDDFGKNAESSKGYWETVKKTASANIAELAKQESYYGKVDSVIAGVNRKLREMKALQDKSGPARPKQLEGPGEAKESVRLAAELSEFKAHQQTLLKELELLYDQGKIQFDKYWSDRRSMLVQNFEKERQILIGQRGEAELDKKPDKVRQINAQIFALEEQHRRDLLGIEEEKKKDFEKTTKDRLTIEKTLADAKFRATIGNEEGLTGQFQKEISDLQTKQESEIQLLTDHNATKEQLNDAHRSHELEQEQLLADQKKRLMDATLDSAKQSLGFMSEAFGDMYEATGKKQKAWAQAQRATQIALAVISTYESAVNAYNSAAAIPMVGHILGPIAAGAAIVAGMAKVAAMRSQPLASGGEVQGYSPTPKSDNIPLWGTAGEFMQPVSAVRKYGLGAMEAIRRGQVPADVLKSYSLKGYRPPSGFRMAEGGSVPGVPPRGAAGAGGGQPITIVNVLDPNEFDKFLWSPQGTDSIVNIIASNQDRIRRLQTQ